MINLYDKIWKQLEGGYKMLYDVSIPLKELETTNEPDKIEKIWSELWNELHHQGDVGLASYMAVPQLARIAITKGFYNWNLLGICTIIEQQRHSENNPTLPIEYQNYYEEGLKNLKKFVLSNLNKETDSETFRVALSTLAVCSGEIKLSKLISKLDEDIIDEILDRF